MEQTLQRNDKRKNEGKKKMNIDKGYVSAMLDNNGCFGLSKVKRKDMTVSTYPFFRITVAKKSSSRYTVIKKTFAWLRQTHEINSVECSTKHVECFQINKIQDISRLLLFMKKNCFVTKENQEEVKQWFENKNQRVLERFKVKKQKLIGK